MSLKDPVDCKVSKFYEGDVQANKSLSECLVKKIAENVNGIKKAWKLECKEFTGSGSWTSPEQTFGMVVIAHSMTSNFLLNQFGAEVISPAGRNGMAFINNIQPNTNYSYSTSGTLTVVCLSC